MQNRAITVPGLVAGLLLAVAPAPAQYFVRPWWDANRVESPSQGGKFFGADILEVPDLDGDGWTDLLVNQLLIAGNDGLEGFETTSAWAFSGQTGDLIFPLERVRQLTGLTGLAWIDDRRPGGAPLLVIGDLSAGAPAVSFCSAANGSLLRTTTIEAPEGSTSATTLFRLVRLGDVDGDGVDDIAVGGVLLRDSATSTLTGLATALSGADGSTLWRRESPGVLVGANMITIDDRDGDGVAELAATALDLENSADSPGVLILDGASGDLRNAIRSSLASASHRYAGLAVTSAGLLAIGDPHPGEFSRGVVTMHNIDTGAQVDARFPPSFVARNFGYTILTGVDVSADGQPDMLVGAPLSNREPNSDTNAAIYVFDDASGDIHWRYAGTGGASRPNDDIGGAGLAVVRKDGSFAGLAIPFPGSLLQDSLLGSVTGRIFLVPTPDTCPADLTGDGVVNGADLGALLGDWGFDRIDNAASPGTPGNFNLDIRVDGIDLSFLLAKWGPCN